MSMGGVGPSDRRLNCFGKIPSCLKNSFNKSPTAERRTFKLFESSNPFSETHPQTMSMGGVLPSDRRPQLFWKDLLMP